MDVTVVLGGGHEIEKNEISTPDKIKQHGFNFICDCFWPSYFRKELKREESAGSIETYCQQFAGDLK